MIIYIYKWRKRWRFSHPGPAASIIPFLAALSPTQSTMPGKTALFLSFPYVRPEPVLVK
eukprot:COSAG06_NODE_26_length_32102_cov_250.952911_24_plen_59_part_00